MKNFSTAMLVGGSLFALACAAAPAWGQSASTPTATDDQDILVTGSRIKRDGYDQPTPTVTTSAADLQMTSPQSLAQGLVKLPAFAGSNTQQGSGQGAIGAGGSNNVGSVLNLRNFGTIRTLILLDGKRVVPNDPSGNIDVDQLPQALIQRVDVVTGGASSVYGSDAVTGVVNYILDRKFTGIKGTVQAGVSTYGDGGSHRANLAAGLPVSDRGHLLLSGEYRKNNGVVKESRPWFDTQILTGAGTAASPYRWFSDVRVNTSTYGGLIRRTSSINSTLPASLANMRFNPDGTLSTYNPGTATNSSTLSVGGDGTYNPNTNVLVALRVAQGFGRFDYDLTDGIHFYAQASYSDSHSSRAHWTPGYQDAGDSQLMIYSGNAFLRPEVQALLTANNVSSFLLSKVIFDKNRPVFRIDTRAINAVAGLEGKIGDFSWDVGYTHGESRLKQTATNNINNPRFYAAVDAVRDGSGNIVCRVTLTNPGLYPGCVPLNIFGSGNISDAAIDYVSDTTGYTGKNKLDDVTANITGNVFDLWAGPVSIAVGGEYRRQSLVQTTTNSPTDPFSFTGLRGAYNSRTLQYNSVLVGATSGSNNVWELNGEVIVPLLKNSPLGRSLELSGAFRYTDYSTSGSVQTWKVGLDYAPISDIRFRGTVSRDIRAPTLYELYAPYNIRGFSLNDPLTGVNRSSVQIQSGNPNLTPEIAKTYTFGVVLQPSFLRGVSASVDWYDIKVRNAITTVDILTQIRTCTASGGTSPFCANIVRPISNTDTSAANYPTSYTLNSINAATNRTKGVDAQISYRTTLDSIREDSSLTVRVLGSYQPTLKIEAYPGAKVLNYAGVGDYFSKWRITTDVSLKLGNFSFNVLNRYKSGVKWNADPAVVYVNKAPGDYDLTDVTISHTIPVMNGHVETFINVSNVFNRAPRIFPNTTIAQIAPIVTGDDVMGRAFTIGARFQF